MKFNELKILYQKTLLENVIPFWMRYAADETGGLNTCIADDGEILNRDKWGWSQWRAVWVFSKLYNSIEQRPEWLDMAKHIYDFVVLHGPLENGHWPLLLDGDGKFKRGYESIYNDGFAIYGMVELYRATKEKGILNLAMKTFEACETALSQMEPPPAWPYPIEYGCVAHGISMLFSIAYHELANATNDKKVRAASDYHHNKVMNEFLRHNRGMLLEFLASDGTLITQLALFFGM